MSRLLEVVFAGTRHSGGIDLEAVEMLVRGAMHRVGAQLLARLLSESSPAARPRPCDCGHTARYYDKRPRQLLTALGPVQFERAYYRCGHCGRGHSRRDRELDVEGTACSPGVRRMLAVVGSESSFERGREQLQLLAGLQVTTKAVERHAEAVGADIAAGEQAEIRRARQLELPQVCAPAVPLLYIEMDGTGVPVVQAETAGRGGKIAIRSFEHKAYSWDRGWSRPAARPSSARDSNSPACSGRCAEPTPSSPGAATASAVSSRTTGKAAPALLDLPQICRAPFFWGFTQLEMPSYRS